MTCCDWCEKELLVGLHGMIVIHQKAPIAEYIDDEIFNLCSEKCLRSWVNL